VVLEGVCASGREEEVGEEGWGDIAVEATVEVLDLLLFFPVKKREDYL